MTEKEILELSLYILGGLAAGFVIYKLVMPMFSKLASKTAIKSDDLVINTVRKWVIPWACIQDCGVLRWKRNITTGYSTGCSSFSFLHSL